MSGWAQREAERQEGERREIDDLRAALETCESQNKSLAARANEAHSECLRLRGLIDAHSTAETIVANRALSRVATLEARVAEMEALYREAHQKGAAAMLEAALSEASDDGWGEHINDPERDNEIQKALRRLRVSHDPPEGRFAAAKAPKRRKGGHREQ